MGALYGAAVAIFAIFGLVGLLTWIVWPQEHYGFDIDDFNYGFRERS